MNSTRYLVISSSLHPGSRSRVLARHALEKLRHRRPEALWLDAAELRLPTCDGSNAWSHDGTKALMQAVEEADGVIIAMGVYNFAAPAATKTLLELAGKAWTDKVVGFACAAGGPGAYMSVMGLANSLMLDFRSVIVPRFVYATGSAFEGDAVTEPDVAGRIDDLAADVVRITDALRGSSPETSA